MTNDWIWMILGADYSCDETFLVHRFATQLPEDKKLLCLTPNLPGSLVDHQRMTTVPLTRDLTRDTWDKLLQDHPPERLLLWDLPSLLTFPELSGLPLDWLEGLPAAAMLFRTTPYIPYCPSVRIVPPNPAGFGLAWCYTDSYLPLSRHGLKDQVRAELGLDPDTRLVALVFSPAQITHALLQGLQAHYAAVIELVTHYLARLPGKNQLVVLYQVAEGQYPVPTKGMALPSAAEAESIALAADLILTESISHPLLLVAEACGIPAMVLGGYGEGAAGPEATRLEAWLKQQAADMPFSYVSFPSPSDSWVAENPHTGRFRYWLTDVWNEAETVTLLERALQESAAPRPNRVQGAMMADDILRALSESD